MYLIIRKTPNNVCPTHLHLRVGEKKAEWAVLGQGRQLGRGVGTRGLFYVWKSGKVPLIR